ncbi:MAG TPA: KaiC domain-containing protein [Candidatus Aenigmarchaeota archaeon]|nr:KaiC domain-containing protein [Candidatus Aenigmarchaeota archaeon]
MLERVSTGIQNLDKLVGGGYPKGSAILVTGGTGTGKTIFSAQFLWDGLKKGEKGIFISLEENENDIREDVKQFGWDFLSYEKKGILRLYYYDPFNVADIEAAVSEVLTGFKPQRLVLDSISIIGLYLKDPATIRKKIYQIIRSIKDSGCTSLLTSEVLENKSALSRFGVEEFVVDGVIVLNYFGIGELSERSLQIRKMRKTDHGKDVYPFEITKNGITLIKID